MLKEKLMPYYVLGLFAVVSVIATAIAKPDSLLYVIAGYMSLLMAPYAIVVVVLMLAMAFLVFIATGILLWETCSKAAAYLYRVFWKR